MATLINTTITGTFQLPAGTTAQRPVTPVKGMMRYNSTYGVNEVYNGTVWWDMTYDVPSDIGLGATTPAVSGTQLLQCRSTYATGNYYIQPPGQPCYQVYVDMTNQGGGWVLVACGRQGASNGIAWWNDAGGGTYSTGLVAANLASNTVAYMPTYWIRALVGGDTWNNRVNGSNRRDRYNRYNRSNRIYWCNGTNWTDWVYWSYWNNWNNWLYWIHGSNWANRYYRHYWTNRTYWSHRTNWSNW